MRLPRAACPVHVHVQSVSSLRVVHCVSNTAYVCASYVSVCAYLCVCVLLIVQHMLFDCMWHKKRKQLAPHICRVLRATLLLLVATVVVVAFVVIFC